MVSYSELQKYYTFTISDLSKYDQFKSCFKGLIKYAKYIKKNTDYKDKLELDIEEINDYNSKEKLIIYFHYFSKKDEDLSDEEADKIVRDTWTYCKIFFNICTKKRYSQIIIDEKIVEY